MRKIVESVWSSEKAWWLGVTFGDGYSDNRKGRRRVVLVGGDLDLLEKWLRLTAASNPIRQRSDRCWSVEVGDQELTTYLESYGMNGKKGDSLRWPLDLPGEFFGDFIRGLWDTDGSVQRQKGVQGRADLLRLSFSNKSEFLVRGIATHVPFELAVSTFTKKQGRYKDYLYWTVLLGGREAETFFEWLYLKTPTDLYAARKRQVGLDFLEWAKVNTSLCERCGREVRASKLCHHCKRIRWEGVCCAECGSEEVIAKGLCRACYQKQWKQARASWTTDPKALQWTKAVSQGNAEESSEEVIRKAVAIFREKGFPWVIMKREEPGVLVKVQGGDVVSEQGVLTKVGRVGQTICTSCFLHRFEAKHRDRPSVVDAFNDDRWLRRAIHYQLKLNLPIVPNRVVHTLLAMIKGPTNFPPVLARWLVDQCASQNGVVFDPCSGYGGRLLGSIASHKNVSYIGFDVEPRSVHGGERLAKLIEAQDRVRMEQHGVEDDVEWPKADLILTSPPYYDREVYGSISESYRKRYPTYDSWVEGFLTPLVRKALRAAPTVILNVAPIRCGRTRYDLGAAVRELTKGRGEVVREFIWRPSSFGAKSHYENILVISLLGGLGS